jgi:hypothetical protein
MPNRVAISALFALLAQSACGADAGKVSLRLPHKLQEGEQAWLEVRLGVVDRGETVAFTTPDGKPLGVISPFGIRAGEAAGAYTVPLPANALSGDRLELRIWLRHPGKQQRAPTADEVKSIDLKISNPAR